MLITWRDGLERSPNGLLLREIPQRHIWASSLWISKQGDIYRRHWNAVSKSWRFDAEPPSMSLAQDGRVGYNVDGGWKSEERCIALAWLRRHPSSTSYISDDVVELVDGPQQAVESERTGPDARSIAWATLEYDTEPAALAGERWRTLSWRCGVVPCDSRYKISSQGRLRNPQGKTTRGFWFDGGRWAAVKGAGLVDLYAAAGLREDEIRLSPAIHATVQALMTRHEPSDLVDSFEITEGTAWSYISKAAAHISGPDLRRIVPRLVSVDLWALLVSMRDSGEAVVGGSLTELRSEVLKRLSRNGTFQKSSFGWEELRLARLAVLAP